MDIKKLMQQAQNMQKKDARDARRNCKKRI